MANSKDGGGIQATRAAHNQALWREVNERIKDVAQTSAEMEFICECADLDCTMTLKLSLVEYELIRRSPVRFPIAPGHEVAGVEKIVEENHHYVVVEKLGEAAEVSAELDPRS
jgi:hypothetical protein